MLDCRVQRKATGLADAFTIRKKVVDRCKFLMWRNGRSRGKWQIKAAPHPMQKSTLSAYLIYFQLSKFLLMS